MNDDDIIALVATADRLGEEAGKIDPICAYLAAMISQALHEAMGKVPRATANRSGAASALNALTAMIGQA